MLNTKRSRRLRRRARRPQSSLRPWWRLRIEAAAADWTHRERMAARACRQAYDAGAEPTE